MATLSAPRAVCGRVLLCCGAAALAGCSSLTGLKDLENVFGSPLVGIDVEPSTTRGGVGDTLVVTAGDTVYVRATGRVGGALGFIQYDRLLDAVWRLSDPALGTLIVPPAAPGDSTSVAHARVVTRGAGTLTITASARGKVGRATVTVRAP